MRTFPDFPIFVASSFLSVISPSRTTNCIWELTYRCNARCEFCSYWRTPSDPLDELKLVEIREGLDNVHSSGCRLINFSGGEPTLRDDLEDIIAYASTKRIWTSMITNGSLIDRPRIRDLKAAGLDNMFVSLDFIDKEEQDQHRGIQGLHDKVFDLLAFLRTDFLGGHRTAGIMCIVSDKNLESARRLTEIAARHGIFIAFQLYHSQKGGSDRFETGDPAGISAALLDLKKRYASVVSSSRYLAGMRDYNNGPRPCSAGRKYFSIDPFGNLHPCVDLPPVGHVLEDPVSVTGSDSASALVEGCEGCWYCFRGEADHALSIRGSVEKILQFAWIIRNGR
jgi:MoaA/NifB/PqqE/SkfB family radical SAM enzyme